MKHLFYLLTIVPIIWELLNIIDTKKIHAFCGNMMLKIKSKETNTFTTHETLLSICMLGYLIWVLIGLMSFQWPIFLFLLLMSFISKSNSIIYRWIDSFVTVLILIFIILNAYHFKINIWVWIFNMI